MQHVVSGVLLGHDAQCHAGGHLIFIYGIRFNAKHLSIAVPFVHMGAALCTLANFRREGCLISVPLLICVGSASAALAVWLMWRKALAESSSRRSSRGVSGVLAQRAQLSEQPLTDPANWQ